MLSTMYIEIESFKTKKEAKAFIENAIYYKRYKHILEIKKDSDGKFHVVIERLKFIENLL